MIVSLEEFGVLVIEDAILSAKIDFADLAEKESLDGSLLGLERCRGKNAEELTALLKEAKDASLQAEKNKLDNYWHIRSQELEIEWVCNCISVLLLNRRMVPIIAPTISAALKATEIINKNKSTN